MSRHHRVEELLSRDELTKLEEFAREPARTVDHCLDWMLANGHRISRGAVGNWKKSFHLRDQVRQSAEMAREFVESAGLSRVQMLDASMTKFQQVLFEALAESEEKDFGELLKASLALKAMIASAGSVEEFKRETEERHRAAIAAAEKVAAGGASGDAVASKVREVLGIKV